MKVRYAGESVGGGVDAGWATSAAVEVCVSAWDVLGAAA